MIYVYVLPERLSNGFCFGGPVPIVFGNVDWFNDVGMLGSPPLTKEQLSSYIRGKRYYDPERKYLVLGDRLTFTLTGVSD